mmetsp:Transcript_16345/g.35831  ORF Transcript_16345/g.35831 Transcript_16345/m.35831 type:complete len:140 (+) Transcript_16345:178-597(+)
MKMIGTKSKSEEPKSLRENDELFGSSGRGKFQMQRKFKNGSQTNLNLLALEEPLGTGNVAQLLEATSPDALVRSGLGKEVLESGLLRKAHAGFSLQSKEGQGSRVQAENTALVEQRSTKDRVGAGRSTKRGSVDKLTLG